MEPRLEDTILTTGQITKIIHMLAALQHRQWILWEGFIVPFIESDDQEYLDALQRGELPYRLTQLIQLNSEAAVGMVGVLLGGYAWPVPTDALIDRKYEQLRGWITYARTCEPDAWRRWKLQCMTPFSRLSPQGQQSDYHEAWLDFQVLAQKGGLVTAEHLPTVGPRTGKEARSFRAQHHGRLRFLSDRHHPYWFGEAPGQSVCQACHYTVSSASGDW